MNEIAEEVAQRFWDLMNTNTEDWPEPCAAPADRAQFAESMG